MEQKKSINEKLNLLPDIATHVYRSADENKSAFSCLAVALGYFHGLGAEQSFELAQEWLQKAFQQEGEEILQAFKDLAEQTQDGTVSFILGEVYASNPACKSQAMEWYSKAILKQHPEAQAKLEILLSSDYLKAAQNGDSVAQFELYQILIQPQLQGLHQQQALEWLQKSAQLYHPQALVCLANHYTDGNGIDQNFNRAVGLYHRAYKNHHMEDAFTALQKLASRDISEAQFVLGQVYEEGQNVPPDINQALKYYESACSQNHALAPVAMGKLREQGAGKTFKTAQNILETFEEARNYYSAALTNGHRPAREYLVNVQNTLDRLSRIKRPEIQRNILLQKLLATLRPLNFAPDLLYEAAHLTGIIRMSFGDIPQEAVFHALHAIGQYPSNSLYARAFMQCFVIGSAIIPQVGS